MNKITKGNLQKLYEKLKAEIFRDVSKRKELIRYNLNGEDIELQKIFWLYNLLLLTIVEDIEEVNKNDILIDDFNNNLFSKFVNKFMTLDNGDKIVNVLTEFTKISVIGNNKLDEGLSLHNIIEGYIKYPDFRAIIDNVDIEGNPILTGDENIYEIERKFAEGIVNMKNVLKDKTDLWFYPFVKNNEGINFSQLFQTIGFIGSKPVVNYDFKNNGVNSEFIHSNFIKGIQSNDEYFINCMSARKAQTVNRMLIQPSGYFMRRLSLITIDTTHNPHEEDCGTDNHIIFNIKTIKELSMINGRSFIDDNDEIQIIDANKDLHLIGETIKLRSPITCDHVHTTGVCKTCIGKKLSTKLRYFNSGMMSVLNLTEPITQNMLNAKHFSSTNAEITEFEKGFYDIFDEVEGNYFELKEDVKILNVTNYELDYSPEFEDEESGDLNVTESIHLIGTETSEERYSIIEYSKGGKVKQYALDNDIYLILDKDIVIDYSLEDRNILNLEDYNVISAYFIIQNNELATGMKKILAVIDNSTFINQLNNDIEMSEAEKASKLLEKFNDLLIYYKLDHIKSWNIEMILSNLFFDSNGEYFDFNSKTHVMEIYPVPKALRYHRSLSVSLSYERLRDQFSDPGTFTKSNKSVLDWWFK